MQTGCLSLRLCLTLCESSRYRLDDGSRQLGIVGHALGNAEGVEDRRDHRVIVVTDSWLVLVGVVQDDGYLHPATIC